MLEPFLNINQALSNFQGHQKFQVFKNQLKTHFIGAKIFHPEGIDQQYEMQNALFMAVINKKNERLKTANQQIKQRQQTLLTQAIFKHKQTIIKKFKQTQDRIKSFSMAIINKANFLDRSHYNFSVYNQLIYHIVMTICNKQQQSSYLIFKSLNTYTAKDLANFGKEFEETVYYLDYDQAKKITSQFVNGNKEAIYIVKIKKKFLFLYPKNNQSQKVMSKDSMKILDVKTIPAVHVQNLYTKKNINQLYSSQDLLASSKSFLQQPSQSQSLIQKNSTPIPTNSSSASQPILKLQSLPQHPLNINIDTKPQSSIRNSQIVEIKDQVQNTSRSSIGSDSILFTTKVKCSKCQKITSQIDCIPWNYSYYCYECLNDINVDTSDIPAARINKFLRQRSMTSWMYQIRCPQCNHLTKIKSYTPANKSKLYQCDLCVKIICVQHKGNIYNCFCFCPYCKIPTIYLQRLNVNFCQSCRRRHCFKCKSTSNNFCKCICKYCLGIESKQHECQPQCHSCNNNPNKLRICRCGLYICYGCYYFVLDRYNRQQSNGTGKGYFPCGETQYQ